MKFYALSKQATLGPCEEPQPGVMQRIFRSKWNAWRSYGEMTKDEAMSAFISKLRSHLYTFPPSSQRDNLLKLLAGVPVTLYVDMMSQPCRAVVWFCLLSRIPFEIKEIRITKRERPADYNQVNPHGTVPAISDNGFQVIEGAAIMRYLTQTYNAPMQMYPKAIRVRAKIDAYIDWHHSNLRCGASNFVQCNLFKPLRGIPVLPEELKFFKELLYFSLKSLEEIFLEANSFVGGTEEFSIADLLCFCELQQLELLQFPFFPEFPRISNFIENMKKVEFCSEVSAVFYKVGAALQLRASKL